jgi:2',3'-cyclic-nucleotide 2'-phosphodiesterase / 3'-nucleotidase / 5'-nucleotidase
LVCDLFPQTTGSPMVLGLGTWRNTPLFTVGETITGWTPPGLPDGLGARRNGHNVEVFMNHEMGGDRGSIHFIENGTPLTGARVTRFTIDVETGEIQSAALAYDRIYDRAGMPVVSATQLNEGADTLSGLDKLCSAALFEAGSYNLIDDIFFTGEETMNGQLFALDVDRRDLWCVPWLGRAKFENVTLLLPPRKDQVAILIGDDTPAAPLYLYLGSKDHFNDGSFLDRNGLAHGVLHVFVANGPRSPQQFNGTGNRIKGRFLPIAHYNAALAGTPGHDQLGFAHQETQYALGNAAGMFRFSRPEDLATDPNVPTRAVLASTGHGLQFPADDWGTTYIIDVDFSDLSVDLRILYDGDDAGGGQFAHPDLGLRNPDNLTWASDGHIYVQEDRSTLINAFGGTGGKEVSIWQIHPVTGHILRVAMVDRTASLPEGQFDNAPHDLGNWETSGIIDISDLLNAPPSEIWLLYTVQAHSIRGGAIANDNLIEGGQLLLLKGDRYPDAVVDVPPQEGVVDLFPVPVATQLFVRFKGADEEVLRMNVLDTQGRSMLAFQSEAKGYQRLRNADVSSLSSGVYILQVHTGNGVVSTRFVKE